METKENINFIFRFNNKSRSNNYFVLFVVSGVLFVGAGFYFMATNLMFALIASVVVAIVYFYLLAKMRPSFFEMLVTEKELQVNFYSVSTIGRSYQSITIPLNQLADYEITNKNLQKSIIFSVYSKYGIADYPPISVSILKKKEIAQIVHVLKQIIDTKSKV